MQVIPLPVDPGEAVQIEVTSADGASLLSYESPLEVPAKTAPDTGGSALRADRV